MHILGYREVPDMVLSPDPPIQNQSFTLRASVSYGALRCPSEIQVALAQNGFRVQLQTFTATGAGTQEVVFTHTVPVAGSVDFIMTIDPENRIAERFESTNQHSVSRTVEIGLGP